MIILLGLGQSIRWWVGLVGPFRGRWHLSYTVGLPAHGEGLGVGVCNKLNLSIGQYENPYFVVGYSAAMWIFLYLYTHVYIYIYIYIYKYIYHI